jgi:hypothetical protein
VQDYEPEDIKTHKGLDLYRMTMADLYKVGSSFCITELNEAT